jgi:ubiquinone/menaquinone biosynthesis C-methylase UbiE
MTPSERKQPGLLGAAISRQASAPHGLLGHIIGRIWIKETAAANDAALDLLAPSPGEHIVEIGHGPGRTIGLLAQRGAQVTGIEVSDLMLTAASRRNAAAIRDGQVRLLRGDGTHLPLPDHTADAALAVHTTYFWAKPDVTLAEICRILRPGGRLVLAIRDTDHPIPRRLDPVIYQMRSVDQLTAILHTAGFPNVATHRPAGHTSHTVFLHGQTTQSARQ